LKSGLQRLSFLVGFVLLIAFIQRFWFVGSWSGIEAISWPWARHTFEILWCGAVVLLLAGLLDPVFGRFIPRTRSGSWVIAVSRVWLVASFFSFFAVQLVGLLGWTSQAAAIHLGSQPGGLNLATRNLFRYAALTAGGLPFLAASYGFPLEDCIAELSKLRTPLGTWGCNGNHEIYAGAERKAGQLFELHGMRLLRQESAELEWRGERFNLIGVDYQRDFMTGGAHGEPLESIEHLVRHDVPNILMSHNPNSFPRAAKLGVELSLAGHTHGGQVKFEIVERTVSPARLITDFVAGLYRLPFGNGGAAQPGDLQHKPAKDAWLYVNRGLGTFGLPLRLGVPPEITLLTLRSV
jgi:hypothetical protein